MQKQIKSKQRVVDFGEVFTNEKEVDAMLDLVKYEVNKIDAKFLEPSAGNGNFLIKILERRLKKIKKDYKKCQYDYEKNVFIAVSNIYGIDILKDNVLECRRRLYDCIQKEYKKIFKNNYNENFMKSINYILEKNIIHGDGLSGLKENDELIIFSNWSMINDVYVKREDFVMIKILNYNELEDESITKSDKNKLKQYKKINFKEVYLLG